MRHVWLIIHTSTYFTGLLEVARMLKQSSNYQPFFFFAQTYSTISRDLATCRAEKIPYLGPGDGTIASLLGRPAIDATPTTSRRLMKTWLGYLPQRIAKKVGKIILRGLNWITVSPPYYLWFLFRRLQFLSRLFRQHKPSLLVLGGDIVGYDTAVFIKAAHREHIPAVVIPGWEAGGWEFAELVQHNPVYSLEKWSNRLVGRLYPRWVYEHNGRRLLPLPASQILAREWLGLAPDLPWVLHSGSADAIAVESEVMRLNCISEGLPPEKLILTGSTVHDLMAKTIKEAAQRREDLYKKLSMPLERPMLLSALPPDYLYTIGMRPECDFQIYNELVYFWVQSLAAINGYNIVITLHPSAAYAGMQSIEQWGVKIAREKTAELIPVCDLFVASISSTIQWAIACGKPVVNYDVYRFRYPDFKGVPGVITFEKKEEFLPTLQRLTQDPHFYTEIAHHQAARANQWGRLDGQSGHRILQLFNQLVEYGERNLR